MGYIATGPGNLAALAIGVLLIVWAIYSRHSRSESTKDASAKLDSEQAEIQGRHTVSLEKSVTRASETALRKDNEQKQARIDALEKELEEAQSIGAKSTANLTVKPGNPSVVIEQLQAELERVKAERNALKNQPGDEELKRRCLELSKQLFRFLEERRENDPQSTTWLAGATDEELNKYSHASTLYMNETMVLYDEQYAGAVMALFNALEQRRWWKPEELDPEERKRLENPGTPYDIRDIARRLSTIGHRLDKGTGELDGEGLRAENEQLRAELDNLKPDANRMKLRRTLKRFLEEGEWLNSTHSREDDIEGWKNRVAEWDSKTRMVILRALGDTQADFYTARPHDSKSPYPSNTDDMVLDALQERLDRLKKVLGRVDDVHLLSDFDADNDLDS